MNMDNLVKRVNDYKAIAKKIDDFQGENKRDFQDWLEIQWSNYCSNIRALRSMSDDLAAYEAMRDELRNVRRVCLIAPMSCRWCTSGEAMRIESKLY